MSNGNIVGSEDCLYLNIWSHDDAVTRPVIVFLHGGGAISPVLDGATLAEEADMIVVTLNRRLGALGYLAIDELVDVADNNRVGNHAVRDVQRALEWLQRNLAAFGGDPAQLILAGQSSGGGVVCEVLASPGSAGLFNAVALHSPGCTVFPVFNAAVGVPTDDNFAADTNRELVTYLGCDTAGDVAACLRNVPAQDIVLAEQAIDAGFLGVVDGSVIPNTLRHALENNTAGDIPMIIGSNADETRNILTGNPIVNDAAYQQRLFDIFDAPLDQQLYALYPTADFASANDAFHALFGDLMFNCRTELVAGSAEGNAPSYMYHFTRGFDNGGLAGLGATHTIDVSHLFGTFDVWGYTPDQQALYLSSAMQAAWRSLAVDPAAPPPYLPNMASAWPVYMENNKQIVEFGDMITIASEHRAGRCPATLALF